MTLEHLQRTAELVHAAMPPTPQYCWPLLAERTGCNLWVKHENHTPIGAFKIRGGLAYMSTLVRESPQVTGVIAATRGNHGQSIAYAAVRNGLRPVIVVPEGNSREKNAAMRAWGAELVVHGHDFQAALEFAEAKAAEDRLHMVPSFHERLVQGVASYALELFQARPDLHTVYAPIGLGSGICGIIAARDALNLKTEVVGVCSENAPCYALSFEQGRAVATNSANTMADGMACRVPVEDAVSAINRGASRIVTVSDDELRAAMRAYYSDTHNIAEGAGAAALAALMKEHTEMAGRKVGVILSGGNIDREIYRDILSEENR
jgi:threonine dehydratase